MAEEEKIIISPEEIKEWNFPYDNINYQITLIQKIAHEDLTKFQIAVGILESLVEPLIKADKNNNYFEECNKKWQELVQQYGKKDLEKASLEFAHFKFKKIIEFIFSKKPIEMVGGL